MHRFLEATNLLEAAVWLFPHRWLVQASLLGQFASEKLFRSCILLFFKGEKRPRFIIIVLLKHYTARPVYWRHSDKLKPCSTVAQIPSKFFVKYFAVHYKERKKETDFWYPVYNNRHQSFSNCLTFFWSADCWQKLKRVYWYSHRPIRWILNEC